jgi:hypothetical protein
MQRAEDGEQVAASLAEWLAGLTFADQDTDAVTALLIDSVVAWARGKGWRAYRRAPSVMTLPPPYAHQHSFLDVGCARPGAMPIAIEIDHSDRRRTVEKLLAEAAAGRIAIWVRWGSRRFEPPPPPVLMIPVTVTSRPGLGGPGLGGPGSGGQGSGGQALGGRALSRQGRLHSRLPATDRPAPMHTGGEVQPEQQPELFPDP